MAMRRTHHGHHAVAGIYPVSFQARVWGMIVGPLVVLAFLAAVVLLYPAAPARAAAVPFAAILLAASASCARLALAYLLAVVVGFPLAILVTGSPALESALLPLFDIFESVPILALFPVLIMLFISGGWLNAAAISILFLAMLWNIVFTLVGGIKIIPKDILYAARIFGLSGLALLRRVILPSVVPQFVTGSILAVAQGWNIIIVAEVLHTYIPGGTAAQDLFGIGALLVQSSATGETGVFVACVGVMVVVIAFFNFFVWQKLLHYSQRFRFE